MGFTEDELARVGKENAALQVGVKEVNRSNYRPREFQEV